jgi:hypothetical protein
MSLDDVRCSMSSELFQKWCRLMFDNTTPQRVILGIINAQASSGQYFLYIITAGAVAGCVCVCVRVLVRVCL